MEEKTRFQSQVVLSLSYTAICSAEAMELVSTRLSLMLQQLGNDIEVTGIELALLDEDGCWPTVALTFPRTKAAPAPTPATSNKTGHSTIST